MTVDVMSYPGLPEKGHTSFQCLTCMDSALLRTGDVKGFQTAE